MWGDQAATCERGYRTVRFDMWNHGCSRQAPRDDRLPAWEDLLALRAVIGDRAHSTYTRRGRTVIPVPIGVLIMHLRGIILLSMQQVFHTGGTYGDGHPARGTGPRPRRRLAAAARRSRVQMLDGREVTAYQFNCVRLWQQDASMAVASGLPGLAALSPLMGGADAALMEQAARVVLEGMAPGQAQGDLLSALGIFGEGLIGAERFGRLIGRGRLILSSLMEYLSKDKLADVVRERAAERAQFERAREQRDREREQERVRQAVIDAVSARFPQAPIAVVVPLQQVRDPDRLYQVLRSVVRAPDQAAAEEAIREVARE